MTASTAIPTFITDAVALLSLAATDLPSGFGALAGSRMQKAEPG